MDQQINSEPTSENLLKTALLEPPQYLVDLRLVYNGQAPRTPAQTTLARMWAKEPDKFLAKLQQAEKDYRSEAGKALRGDDAGGGKIPDEEGEPSHAEVLIGELIERAREPGDLGGRVAGVWDSLSEADRRTVLDIMDAGETGASPVHHHHQHHHGHHHAKPHHKAERHFGEPGVV
jgi:hypothetical protein